MCSIVCRETNFVCCFLARIGGLDSERRLYRANDGTESLLPDNAESEPRPNAASRRPGLSRNCTPALSCVTPTGSRLLTPIMSASRGRRSAAKAAQQR